MKKTLPAPTMKSAPVASPKSSDPVTSPAHYTTGGIETLDFMRAKSSPEEFVGYCRLNAVKYLSRVGLKDDAAQDFAKAAFYAQMAAHTLNPTKFSDPRG